MKAFFSFSPSQFLLEAFAYFKSLPKKIAQGQKWTICILKTQQRANSGGEGKKGGERAREILCLSDFKGNLKETIMPISWPCHAHYAEINCNVYFN